VHVDRDIEVDRNHGTVSEHLQRRAETALGKDRRVDPTRDLLQILDRRYQSRRDAGQLGAEVVPLGGKVRLHRAHGQPERNEPLLRTVMEVALDPTPGLVRRGDDTPPRSGQLRLTLRLRNRRRDELCEIDQS
jgi:hypothetical protein